MPRSIPIALLDHVSGPMVTTSYLLKIGPFPDGSFLGMTSNNVDERYDDGLAPGALTYSAATGVELSTLVTTNDLSVGNGEAQTLVPVYPGTGITEDLIITGQLDTVPYRVYMHNYEDPSMGHSIEASGVLGDLRLVQGMIAVLETRSWSDLLNQTGIISQTSIDCRTRNFGSQPGDEREYCGFDLTGEWVDFNVTDVGTEAVREFYTADLPAATYPPEGSEGYFAPGLMKWTGGDNAGQSLEVESFIGAGAGDAYVSLRFTARKPIKIGDTGQIRRECTRKESGHNSCKSYFPTDRGAHFRGEWTINIGDSVANSVPGTGLSNSTGGTGEASL